MAVRARSKECRATAANASARDDTAEPRAPSIPARAAESIETTDQTPGKATALGSSCFSLSPAPLHPRHVTQDFEVVRLDIRGLHQLDHEFVVRSTGKHLRERGHHG